MNSVTACWKNLLFKWMIQKKNIVAQAFKNNKKSYLKIFYFVCDICIVLFWVLLFSITDGTAVTNCIVLVLNPLHDIMVHLLHREMEEAARWIQLITLV